MSLICPPVDIDLDTYEPTKFGLFSIAKPFPDLDEHWQSCGVTYDSIACADTGIYIDTCTSPGTKQAGSEIARRSAAPFTVTAAWDCAAGGRTPAEHEARAKAALACGLEREVETRFYLGTAEDTPQLVDGGCTALNTTATPVSLASGIGMLEGALGAGQCGVGAIHLPRELGALAARFNQTYGAGAMLRSAMGTPMAFGAGYGNLSPVGVAPPTGIAWLYGTGPVYLKLGESFMNPPNFEDALNRTNNRLRWIAEQKVLLSIDGCACFAVAVSTNGS